MVRWEETIRKKNIQAYLVNFSKHIIPECPLVTLKFKLQLRRSLGIFQHSEPRVNPRDPISKEHRNNEQRLSFWRRRFRSHCVTEHCVQFYQKPSKNWINILFLGHQKHSFLHHLSQNMLNCLYEICSNYKTKNLTAPKQSRVEWSIINVNLPYTVMLHFGLIDE